MSHTCGVLKIFSKFCIDCLIFYLTCSIQNGLLSALPYLVLWIMQNACGILADFIRQNGYLSTKVTRKVFNFAGLALPGLFLIFVGYVGCDHVLAMLMLTLSVGLGGAAMGGFNVNHLDIAPKFAGQFQFLCFKLISP